MFNNLPIAIKVLLAPAVAIAALIGIGIVSISAFNTQIAATEHLDNNIFEPLRQVMQVRDRVTLIHSRLFALISSAANETDAKKRESDANTLRNEIKKYTVEFNTFITGVKEASAIDKFASALAASSKIYLESAQQVVETGSLDASYGVMMMGDANTRFGELRTHFDGLTDALDSTRKIAFSQQVGQMGATQRHLTMMVLGFFLISFLAAFLIGRGIAKPTIRITKAMTEIAGGDLSIIVPHSNRRDEIGKVAAAVEIFKVNAKRLEDERAAAEKRAAEERSAAARKMETYVLADEFEKAVGKIVESVSSASSQLEASAGILTKTADATQELSGTVSAASEQASTNVNSVATATEQLTASVNEISRQVQESNRITGDAVVIAERTNADISTLSNAATRVGDVIKLITAIAEQTNLLALNATIEAARAGESGRGFAVVAQEVKALATQTAKATSEISTQISDMFAATQNSVASIKEIGSAISRIAGITQTIAAAVEEQAATTHEIARNVQQASQRTSDVAANISDVNRGASETGSASGQVLTSARALARESSQLKTEVENFLSMVRAA